MLGGLSRSPQGTRASSMGISAGRAMGEGRRGRFCVSGRLTAAAKVGFDQEPRIVVESRAVDLHIFDDALDVVARLRNRNALDPVDRIDFGIARIAVLL